MLTILACTLGIAGFFALAFLQHRERQSWTVERDRLVQQVLHVAGKPMRPPAPRPTVKVEREPVENGAERANW